ncbi:MAG: hypothetical protein A2Y10_08055 [Planctomycetes bacterium GWF2_41_51]|nr:MAG: hypothetical protein A2Y10_08055 [Planctomycetes bacterium GWF2_41_51]HBG26238.1 hypothetical protein [Phycisphaerales bacterium]
MANDKTDNILRFSAAADKLHGVYPQKQEGLFMLRVKIPGGRLTWPQWRVFAQVQETYSPDTPVHFTTRQDIEFHNLQLGDIVEAQKILIKAGLSFYGSGGDALRNVTVCSGCGLCAESFEVFEISVAVEEYLQSLPASANLPRKFKISFSGCQKNCARPYLNDIGFIAVSESHFNVITAGSLGPIPALGIETYKNLQVSDVFFLCRAAIEMFAELGDRTNRRKARLRHIRQKLGDDAFLSELDRRFKQVVKEPQPNINSLSKSKPDFKLLHRLNIPDGDISTEQIIQLADLCENQGVESRINFEHGIELYGSKHLELPVNLKQFENGLVIIACQGGRTCPYGLINTQNAALKIRKAYEKIDHSNIHINISGCSNNCAHSAAAAIGFVGLKRDGKEHVQLYTGGGDGKNPMLAQKREIIDVENITSDTFNHIK